MKAIATSAPVEKLIHVIRNQTVMLDSDLARLYGVTTGNLNLAVKRNRERFPSDFMFTLTETEAKSLILQFATSNGRGGRRKQFAVVFDAINSLLDGPKKHFKVKGFGTAEK